MPSTKDAPKNYAPVNISDAPVTTTKHFTRLGDYLEALGDMTDRREVRRALDANLELGAIVHCAHEPYVPMPLFTHYDSLPQARLARVALSLELDLDTSQLEIVDTLARASTQTPVPPVMLEEQVCQQNVVLGEEVDLTEGDALPRAADWAHNISKDPQERVLAQLGD
jgi:3-polyprenyl-4-hydroxybenzoate decarboxylase